VADTPKDAMTAERAWLIERDHASTPLYWTGRAIHRAPSDPDRLGEWSPDVNRAVRFARRTDAACMLTWHCQDQGRVVEHMWVGGPGHPEPPTERRTAMSSNTPPPAGLSAAQIEFCAEDGEWGGPCCPFCSASPEGQHRDDCAWAKSAWTRERIAKGIAAALRALHAAPKPTAGLVEAVREWQAAMMEFGAELDASHMVSARTEKRLKDASQALFTIDTHADLC